MAGLWKNVDGTREGKYLVQRRDGTVPNWPWFVLAASDPAAPAALAAYAQAAAKHGMDPAYIADINKLVYEFACWRLANAAGDPDAGKHRQDDAATVAKMQRQTEINE